MRILLIGAGDVGQTIVEALHGEHELTVVDLDPRSLAALSYRFDVRTVIGNGATRSVLQEAGVEKSDLVMATTSRDEANLVAAMLVKRLSRARTIVRTSNAEYLEAWREREIDVDFMVSAELEAANAVAGAVGIPAARQTDVFADGQVQIVEFDVPTDVERSGVLGQPLRAAAIPPDSKVATIIRGDRTVRPDGDASIEAGDRVVVIGSPAAARQWSRALALEERTVDNAAVFGAGRVGTAIASGLLDRGIRVRLIEADGERARTVAAQLPGADVFETSGIDPEFLERERIGNSAAAVFCMRDDPKNLYAAILARLHGVPLTIAVIHDVLSTPIFEESGIDVTINPRALIAEEMVRFAHDPRIRQLAMLEGDRFEVLDITVREDSDLAGRSFRDLPETGSVIGAVIRDGSALFPHSTEVLRPGDRVIVFVESRRASLVERAL
ncbi:MAG: trk/ktr system potassium uptake protein [Solirubrobacteraceae bacterium]|jgi:trk system potassium uptake protein TrkA|nr:trk/ktr system potassium uptake protein [Solirubrobacteraceae bacterium]